MARRERQVTRWRGKEGREYEEGERRRGRRGTDQKSRRGAERRGKERTGEIGGYSNRGGGGGDSHK